MLQSGKSAVRRFCFALSVACLLLSPRLVEGEDRADPDAAAASRTVRRLLLLGQSRDNHPAGTHEYMAGVELVAKWLQPVENVQAVIVKADEPWRAGPELLDGADGAVLFLSEGAKWLSNDPQRLAAFQQLARRQGGLVCLHWGMGCREAQPIDDFVALFGGCHGGPDRKYKVLRTRVEPSASGHPIVEGLSPFEIHDEFYYRLKFAGPRETAGERKAITPLVRISIDDEPHTVAWAWERPDGGRSAGFSGGHFHEHWNRDEYRRLMTRSILWTLKIDEDGK